MPKRILICLFSGTLILGLFFVCNKESGLSQGLNSQALAEESLPINCKRQTEIKLPGGLTFELGPNELEVPIGKTTDQTEAVAEKILAQLQIIIDAAAKEIAAAEKMLELANKCGVPPFDCAPHCQSQGGGYSNGECFDICPSYKNNECDENTYCTWYCTGGISCCSSQGQICCCDRSSICVSGACSGPACPTGIPALQIEIGNQAAAIKSAYNEIEKLFIEKLYKPVGFWWTICPPPPLPPNPLCLTIIEFILKELERSRSGDYEFFNILRLPPAMEWNHRPPGLKDCVVRPEDMEALIMGEKAGKYLFDCRTALSIGLIDECYGLAKCEAEKAAGRVPPKDWLCPRLENYYCCE